MTYKDLIVYQKAIDFIVEVYSITKKFPAEEKFGLISQLQRAAVSIPANISEGSQRQSKAEYVKFLYFSWGSCSEIETFLLICLRLQYYRQNRIR